MNAEPLDVELTAMGGYLVYHDRWRQIPFLDQIARDTLTAGVRVYWGHPLGSETGCALLWSREIVLSPLLMRCPNWRVRRCWSHELAHCTIGRQSEERARLWQSRRYGGWLLPAFVQV